MVEELGIPHAGIEMDALGWSHPLPPRKLTLDNLAAVWKNFSEAGAERLILVQTLESRNDLEVLREAVPGARIVVFRLWARVETLLRRVNERELGGLGQELHREQADRLARAMEQERIGDHVVTTEDRLPGEIAAEILHLSGWGDADQRGTTPAVLD